MLARASHLTDPDCQYGSRRKLLLVLLDRALLLVLDHELRVHQLADLHQWPPPFLSSEPLVGRHPIVADAELVREVRGVLDNPFHGRRVLRNTSFDARLQRQLERPRMRRHVLHGLLARPVRLRVINRWVSRDCPPVSTRLNLGLHIDDCRLTVSFEYDVTAAKLLQVLGHLLDRPLVANALADDLVVQDVARRLILAHDGPDLQVALRIRLVVV